MSGRVYGGFAKVELITLDDLETFVMRTNEYSQKGEREYCDGGHKIRRSRKVREMRNGHQLKLSDLLHCVE